MAEMGSELGLKFCTLILILTGLPAWGAEIVELVPLHRRDTVLVSFRMTEAFGEEVERAVASGLRFPSFKDDDTSTGIEKANKFAAERSRKGGAGTQGFLGKP